MKAHLKVETPSIMLPVYMKMPLQQHSDVRLQCWPRTGEFGVDVVEGQRDW